MPALICEGLCNPGHRQVMAAVDTYRRAEARLREVGDPILPIADPTILAELRRLRHTDHARVGLGRWACRACGTARVWGA